MSDHWLSKKIKKRVPFQIRKFLSYVCFNYAAMNGKEIIVGTLPSKDVILWNTLNSNEDLLIA